MSSRDDYVSAIKSAFITMGDKAVEGIIITYLPFLSAPIFSSILDYLVNMIMTDLVNNGEIAAFFVYIDFRVNKQGQDFSEAAIENHIVQQNGTAKEKALAEANLWNSFRLFAKLTA